MGINFEIESMEDSMIMVNKVEILVPAIVSNQQGYSSGLNKVRYLVIFERTTITAVTILIIEVIVIIDMIIMKKMVMLDFDFVMSEYLV